MFTGVVVTSSWGSDWCQAECRNSILTKAFIFCRHDPWKNIMAIAKKENVLCVSGRRRAPSVKKQRCFLRAVTKIDPGWHAPVCRLQLTRNGKFVWVVCFAIISEIQKNISIARWSYLDDSRTIKQADKSDKSIQESAVHLMGFFSNSSDVV